MCIQCEINAGRYSSSDVTEPVKQSKPAITPEGTTMTPEQAEIFSLIVPTIYEGWRNRNPDLRIVKKNLPKVMAGLAITLYPNTFATASADDLAADYTRRTAKPVAVVEPATTVATDVATTGDAPLETNSNESGEQGQVVMAGSHYPDVAARGESSPSRRSNRRH